MSFATTATSYDNASNWLLLIFDQNGLCVDVPQDDVESWQVQCLVNGGSGEGTFTFRRPFNDIGAVGYNYSLRLWIWPPNTTMPTDPYWAGHQEDPDQVQLSASGQCVVHAYGDHTYLNDGIVSFAANPGVGGNPSLDCADLLRTLWAQFGPPGWLSPVIPATMFPLLPVTYTHQGFGDVIDDLLKQGRDSTGVLFLWYVKTFVNGSHQLVVQIDQNPNVLDGTSGKPLVLFRHLFANSDFTDYKIANKYRDIYNVVAVYGAKDPTTGVQAFGVYEDATSVAQFGRTKEQAITVDSLQTTDACQAYGQVWLELNAYPSAQGTARLLQVDPTITAGTWVQFWEAPADASNAASIKQVRCTQIDLSMTKPNRIDQVIGTTSPVPFLDKAIYRLGAEIKTQTQISNVPITVNRQVLYIRSGGALTATHTSPAKVALSACQAVFPGTSDSKIVRAAALALTQLTDNSGGPNNGQTGDGAYTVSVTSTGTWVITKGDRPGNTPLQQNVLGAMVVNGAPFCYDLRILTGLPGFSTDLPTIALAGGHTPTVGVPANNGAGAVDLPLDFWLDATTWTSANHRLSYFEVGALPHSSSQPVATYTKVIPTADGHLAPSVPGLGAGGSYDIYVTAFDNLDRPTQALLLFSNVSTAPIGAGSIPPVSGMPAPAGTLTGSLTNVASTHPTQADISALVTINNVPQDGSVTGLAWWFREHGTTTWTPFGVENLAGTPATPTNPQTLGFVYAQLANAKLYDFAVGYVGLAGYGVQAQIGTTAQKTNGFQAQTILVPTKYLDNGVPVTPQASLGTLHAPASIGDQSFVFDSFQVGVLTNGSTFMIGNSFPQTNSGTTNDLLVVNTVSFNSGTGQGTITTVNAAGSAFSAGSNCNAVTPVVATSLNGVSADVTLDFWLLNQPTDGTLSRIHLYYRKSSATKWSDGGQQPAAGVLTTPQTTPINAEYTFGIADLINNQNYDFAVALVAASGSESSKKIIVSGFHAQTLNIPTGGLPTIPAGTIVTAAGTISGYDAVLGGTYIAKISVTPNVSSSAAFATWGGGFRVLAKVNDTGSLDTDTNRAHYNVVADIKNNSWSAGSLSLQTNGLSAGHAFQLALIAYDQAEAESSLSSGAIFALTTAQQIGSGTIIDGPNLVPDPNFSAARIAGSNYALSAPHWAFYGIGGNIGPNGTPPVCILEANATGPHAFVVLSDAGGSGHGGSGVNYQAISEAMRLKGGTQYCVSAYIDAHAAGLGAGTGAPSIAIVSHDVGAVATTLSADVAQGDKVLHVTSAAKLGKGKTISVTTSGVVENFVINDLAGTTVTVNHAAAYAHTHGDNVAVVTSWDPMVNDPSQPGYAPQFTLVRAEATQAFGATGIVSQVYTPTIDEIVSVLFQTHGAKNNVSSDGLFVFAKPMLQVGSAPGPFNHGPTKKGPRPTAVQATTWTTSDGPVDTQGGVDPGTGGGVVPHDSLSWQSQAVIDSSANVLNVPLVGTKLAPDGSYTGVFKTQTSQLYNLKAGQTIRIAVALARSS